MEGQINFGYVGSAMQNVIPQLLLKIREDHPKVHYSLREMENPDQIDALIQKEIDLAFIRLDKVPKGLEIQPVFEDTFSNLGTQCMLSNPKCFMRAGITSLLYFSFNLFIPISFRSHHRFFYKHELWRLHAL